MQEQRVEGEAVDFGGAAAAAGGLAAAGSKRLLAAFSIVEKKGYERPFWNRIGSAFFNRDGSINVYLDALPLQGKIQLREETQKDRERGEGGRRGRSEPQHDEE